MTQYLKPSFTVLLGSKEYAENWDAVFGKKEHYHVTCEECDPPPEAPQLQLEKPESLPRVCRTCSEGHGDWPHVHTEVTGGGGVRVSWKSDEPIIIVPAGGDMCGNTRKLPDGDDCPGCRACC